jgi:hypothetical protein
MGEERKGKVFFKLLVFCLLCVVGRRKSSAAVEEQGNQRFGFGLFSYTTDW